MARWTFRARVLTLSVLSTPLIAVGFADTLHRTLTHPESKFFSETGIFEN